jgi:type II secretory pathway component PulF
MSTWAYTAINEQGIESKGELEATDATSAREQLRARGLMASALSQTGATAVTTEKSASAGAFAKKIKPKSLQIFSRQFATMIEAGISVVGALVVLEEQTDDKALADVIAQVRMDVEAGMQLSEACAKHPKVFNRLYIAMVETGEAAGILDQVLDRVAYQIEKETKIKRRVKGAMLYPTIVLTFAAIVLSGMLMFLVPIFTKIFSQLNGQLPTLTQKVVGASNILRGYWFVIFPAVIALIFAFKKWKATEGGRRVWDQVKLRLPMKIGDTVRKITLARFSRTLSTLVAARGAREGARGHSDLPAAVRGPRIPADGRPHGQGRRGDGRARQDAQQGRRLLRGRGRHGHPDPDVHHRADDDDLRRACRRRDHHLDVPADVQDALARQVAPGRAGFADGVRSLPRREPVALP